VIERLTDMPAGTLGFRARGEIEREDYGEAWITGATKLFLWMIPGDARVFPRSELEQAKAWIAAA